MFTSGRFYNSSTTEIPCVYFSLAFVV